MIKLVLALGMLASGVSHARDISPVPAQVVLLDGVVSNQAARQFGARVFKLAAEGKSTIDVVIDSPGGSVFAGNSIISTMEALKQRGITVRCYVPVLAASMAFQIFLHCSERYGLNNAHFLWHRSRVFGLFILTAPRVITLARELQDIDSLFEADQIANMSLSADLIRQHSEAETLHIGLNLEQLDPSFMDTRVVIPGLLELLPANKTSEAPVTILDKQDMYYLHEQFIISK